MDDQELLYRMEDVARRLGIQVRYEPSEGKGGLCVLRGRSIIIADEAAGARARWQMLAAALSEFDLEGIYLPPLVRDAIATAGARRSDMDA